MSDIDYKKILEGVVDIINTTEKSDIGFANICTYIGENCPELKESDDERIRREIIDYIKNSTCQVDNETYKSWIAWLEKQGEKIEQNPAWSEEDEYVYNEILKRVADKTLYAHDLEYIYKWLKSLRPQNT